MVNALIIEQLEDDGVLRSFVMQHAGENIVVAFPDEFDGDRDGPFHFVREYDQSRFSQSFSGSRARRLGPPYFSQHG